MSCATAMHSVNSAAAQIDAPPTFNLGKILEADTERPFVSGRLTQCHALRQDLKGAVQITTHPCGPRTPRLVAKEGRTRPPMARRISTPARRKKRPPAR